jgi:hypothetical protein
MVDGSVSEWRDPEHALGYLARTDTFPHRTETWSEVIVRWGRALI